MTFGLDTSVLVRLLVGRPAAAAELARGWLVQTHREGYRVVVTDVVLAEAWYAVKLHYGADPDETRTALRAMLDSGVVQSEPRSGAGAALRDAPGSAGFVDRLLHARHGELGAQTVTFDRGPERRSAWRTEPGEGIGIIGTERRRSLQTQVTEERQSQ